MCMYMHVCVLSHFSHVQLFTTLGTILPGSPVPCQGSSGNNTGVGCLALLQGIFPTKDQTCVSCFGGRFLTAEPIGKPVYICVCIYVCVHSHTHINKYTHTYIHTYIYIYIYLCVLSHVHFFVTPWTRAHQALLSMEFFRQ